jgi:predicted O-methyltransferase YrrM
MNWWIKNILRRLAGRNQLADPAKIVPGAEVDAALGMGTTGKPAVEPDLKLGALVQRALARSIPLSSRDLFSLDGQLLPCWLESDVDPVDDWVTADDYYPLYYRLFQEIAVVTKEPRMLEIGVRTGYMGVTFARAVLGHGRYLGIDPNLYLADGLTRANASFKLLQTHLHAFRFACLLGYSDNAGIRRKIHQKAPFDIIHIDGDHTLGGKLQDLDLARSLLTPDGFVLVDDYDHIPDVIQEAVSRALKLGWYSRFARLATRRGLGILQL